MKKICTFFLLTLLLGATSIVKAQTWDSPSYQGADPVSGTAYYVYNIGSNGFLNQGGSWETQAIVSPTPRKNVSTSMVSWTVNNTSASNWTLHLTIDGVEDGNASDNYVTSSSTTSVYTDQGSGWGEINWVLTEVDASNNIYTLQRPSETTFLGTEADPETVNRGVANPVKADKATGTDYVNWKFVTVANYELYLAKVELDRYMTYAKALGTIDLSSYIATYNTNVTADIETASSNLLTALNPTSVSISNNSFESNFDSWTNGGFATQTNTPGQGWTKDGNTYAEKWTSSINSWGETVGYLSNLSISQTLTVSNGLYGLVTSAHAVQHAGANPLNSGVFLTCGSEKTEISAGGEYYVDMVEVSNGSLTIGYDLINATVNWTGFDNFVLYYYGESAVASSDATLSDIEVSSGIMNPAFTTGTTSYTVTLPSSSTTVNVNATSNHAASSFTINSTSATNGANQAVALTSGSGTATIEVTAEDGTTTETYTINFVGTNATQKHSYTFADGTADDQVEVGSVDGITSGSSLSIANGAATVSGASTSTDGYISFDGTSLALNTYDEITLEAYIKAGNSENSSYSMLSYFGSSTAGSNTLWMQPTRGDGTYSRIEVNNGASKIAQSITELDDGAYHHLVAILNDVSLDYYIDGSLVASTATGSDYISTIGSDLAYLFKGAWSDANYNGSIYEFNIYNGSMASSTIESNSASFVDAAHDATLSDLTINGTTVAGFSASTFTYEVKVDEGDPVPTVVGTLNDANASTSQTDAASIPSSTVVTVTAEDGKTLGVYTINFIYQSADATLSALNVDAGYFHGSFDAETTTYEVLVPAGISSINVTATANHVSASVTDGTGSIDMTGGNTSTVVEVTAEDGSTKTYTVNFTVSSTNYIFGWDGNTLTGSGTSPLDFGWENTSGYSDASDVDGCCGARLRVNPSGYIYEDDETSVTGRQQLLRYDGNTASETAAWTYPVELAANSSYVFSFDYVFGGSGTAPAIITAGVGTSNDVNNDVASNENETSSSASSYRSGTLFFQTSTAGTYYVKFKVNKRCWVGINNLELAKVETVGTVNITSDSEYGSLTIPNGASFVVSPGVNLSINELVNNAGAAGLVLQSNASGTAILSNNSTGVAATVQQYIAADQYYYMGVPVSETITKGSAFPGCFVYAIDEASATDGAQTGWTELYATDNLILGKGYAVYSKENKTLEFTGTINTGSISSTVAFSNQGWNLISNPYPVSIDWDAIAKTSVNATVYVYNNGTYGSWNGSAGVNGQTQYIAPMQAFFVQANAESPAFNFDNDNKANQIVSFKSAKVNSIVRLKVVDFDGKTDETLLCAKADASNLFDNELDGYKLIVSNSEVPQIYTESDVKYSINCIPSFETSSLIPLRIMAKKNGVHTIHLALENVDAQMPVLLLDTEKNILADLSKGTAELDLSAGELSEYLIAFTYSITKLESVASESVKMQVQNKAIVINGLELNSQVDVFNMAGQKINSLKSIETKARINVNKKGLFIVRVQAPDGSVINKKVAIK